MPHYIPLIKAYIHALILIENDHATHARSLVYRYLWELNEYKIVTLLGMIIKVV
uniref:Uncharacterized protein n=1 Tax=Arundo donax TaxID=35708 RepID=A0A0A9A3M9_ARUDO